MFANLLEFIGLSFGKFGSVMCVALLLDEEEMPKSMIK